MSTGGNLEISTEEANQAVVVAWSIGDPARALLSHLPSLTSIWECSQVRKGPLDRPQNGKIDGWQCLHSGRVFYPVSTWRATDHLAQEPGISIVICEVVISEKEKTRCVYFVSLPLSCAYLTPTFLSLRLQVLCMHFLLKWMKRSSTARKPIRRLTNPWLLHNQHVIAESLINSSSKRYCVAARSLKEALGAEVIPRAHERILPKQMSIDAALLKPFVQVNLRAANNARLQLDWASCAD